MKKILFFTFIFFLSSQWVFAIDQESLKKYPYQLLTNDYGILNEANLKRYTYKKKIEPYTRKFNGIDYWQCFPTKNVNVWYEKNDFDLDGTLHSNPYILVTINPTTTYQYCLCRSSSADYAQDKVKKWQDLMKNQQFVCIGGSYNQTSYKFQNGKKTTNQSWFFENLKTKKGCDSYFSGWCD